MPKKKFKMATTVNGKEECETLQETGSDPSSNYEVIFFFFFNINLHGTMNSNW